jgi:CheY-like chemotaxis protein
MSGYEPQRHLLQADGSIAIIFIAAHPDGSRSSGALALGAVVVLHKPFVDERASSWRLKDQPDDARMKFCPNTRMSDGSLQPTKESKDGEQVHSID